MSETELPYRRSSGGAPRVSTISTNNLEISSAHRGSSASTRDSLSPNYERRKLSLRSNKSRPRISSSNRSSRTSGSGEGSPTKSERSSSSAKSSASRRRKQSFPEVVAFRGSRPSTLKSSFLRKKIKEYEGSFECYLIFLNKIFIKAMVVELIKLSFASITFFEPTLVG